MAGSMDKEDKVLIKREIIDNNGKLYLNLTILTGLDD